MQIPAPGTILNPVIRKLNIVHNQENGPFSMHYQETQEPLSPPSVVLIANVS